MADSYDEPIGLHTLLPPAAADPVRVPPHTWHLTMYPVRHSHPRNVAGLALSHADARSGPYVGMVQTSAVLGGVLFVLFSDREFVAVLWGLVFQHLWHADRHGCHLRA